ncbi:hypothetical protein [Haloarcula litorea]|uniref:hypothetical protein n=1 Tax=Haloarcula litorea TaxID=3032579 RepID=UPI0023E7CBFF|nr:hypothetical protein [Halomicroarcula sp. GDY20]
MDARLAVGLGLLVVLGGTATAVGATTELPFATEEPAFEQTSLRSVETFGPRCANRSEIGQSTVSRPVDGGRLLSWNDTIAVDSHDTTVAVSLRQFGPARFVLDVDRDPGVADVDCDARLRYNATLNVSTPEDFTLVVTHDDRLVGSYYSDESGSGGAASAGASGARPGGGTAGTSSEAGDGGAATDGEG